MDMASGYLCKCTDDDEQKDSFDTWMLQQLAKQNSQPKTAEAKYGSPQLLLVSDFEGCPKNATNGKPQSTAICQDKFFQYLQRFLEINSHNEIAFLGDYFDQGTSVLDVITNIVQLSWDFSPRVHILLGNRDINKLRLFYEMSPNSDFVSPEVYHWPVWKIFFRKMTELKKNKLHMSLDEELNHRWNLIQSMSMGVQLSPGTNNCAPIHLSLTLEQSRKLMQHVFSTREDDAHGIEACDGLSSERLTQFVISCRSLYKRGKIVILNHNFHTLLSHAGGYGQQCLHDHRYYERMINFLDSNFPDSSYFDKMLYFREALHTAPRIKQMQNFDESNYNIVLSQVVESLWPPYRANPLSDPDPPTILTSFFLLQALALKPDDMQPYSSFIQSSNFQSCKGPITSGPLFDESYFISLGRMGIQIVASGHAPVCIPIPLVYQNQGIVFVHADLSNGFRYSLDGSNDGKVDEIPLAFVQRRYLKNKLSMSVGVGFFDLDTSELRPAQHPVRINGVNLNAMCREWPLAQTPTVSADGSIILDKNTQIEFPANKSGNQYQGAVLVMRK